jgi:hypothetical protein
MVAAVRVKTAEERQQMVSTPSGDPEWTGEAGLIAGKIPVACVIRLTEVVWSDAMFLKKTPQ